MYALLAPGQWVRLPSMPEWGIGQVQSAIGMRVTVNFVHGGKRLIQADTVTLEAADPGGIDDSNDSDKDDPAA